MRSALIVAVAVAAAVVPLEASRTTPQRPDPGPALSAVMLYRYEYLGDSTRFDACRIAHHLGDAANVPARLAEPVRRLLDGSTRECPRHREAGRSRIVLVDSVARGDSVTHVHLTVLRGEYIHREDYTVLPLRMRPAMAVREVRIWGAGQAYPVRPRGRGE
jgi:hypothetical protein